MGQRQQFSKEFKLEAVRLLEDGDLVRNPDRGEVLDDCFNR